MATAKILEQVKNRKYKVVPVDSITIWNEANVRHTEITSGIDELAESISKIGLQQPPVVQEVEKGKYTLIVGQRRLLAFRKLGRKEIPVLVQKTPYDLPQATIASVSENLHRKAVVPGDMANACDYLRKQYGSDKEAAKVLGISPPTFKKYLGYKGVPEELKKLVSEKVISVSDANRLSRIVPDVKKAVQFAKTISTLPKPTRERYFAALLEDPESPMPAIKARADRSKYKNVVQIHLPETYAYALYRASTDTEEEPEAIAQRAVMDWLDKSGYVK